jgi:hypothetical protein
MLQGLSEKLLKLLKKCPAFMEPEDALRVFTIPPLDRILNHLNPIHSLMWPLDMKDRFEYVECAASNWRGVVFMVRD